MCLKVLFVSLYYSSYYTFVFEASILLGQQVLRFSYWLTARPVLVWWLEMELYTQIKIISLTSRCHQLIQNFKIYVICLVSLPCRRMLDLNFTQRLVIRTYICSVYIWNMKSLEIHALIMFVVDVVMVILKKKKKNLQNYKNRIQNLLEMYI